MNGKNPSPFGRDRITVPSVNLGNLFVEGQEIPQDTDAEKAGGEEVEKAGEYLAHVETVNAEDAEEGEQDPGDVVVSGSGDEAGGGFTLHGGYQEQVDDPADEKQAQGEEPDGAGDLFAVVETMGPDKTEYPEQVAHQDRMGAAVIIHVWSSR